MRGQDVVVKEFNGNNLVRVEWEACDGLIFIHNREQFEKRMSGKSLLEPVGFPVEDVFLYDQSVLEKAERDGISPWILLIPYKGGI